MPTRSNDPATAPTPPGRGSADPFSQFRSDDLREVLMLLRELRDASTPMVLSSPAGAALSATLWTIDDDRRTLSLDVEAADPQLQPLVDSNEATAMAYLESIKLQFDLHGLMLVRSPRATALRARLPSHVYRFQRRGAYRVRPLDRSLPTAVMRHPSLPDMQLALRIIDVSVDGCALLLPPDTPPLPLGGTLRGVLIELDGGTRFRVALALQHASSLQAPATGLRLGCALLELAPDDQRLLQRYIDQTQKRRRLLSLD